MGIWLADTCDLVAETRDARLNINPGERHWKEHHYRDGNSQGVGRPRQDPLIKSTFSDSKDKDVIFEFPTYPNDHNRPPGRKAVPYDQPSNRREASIRSPQPMQFASPQVGLTRTDTYKSTGSTHSMYDIDSEDYLAEDYDKETVSDNVKIFDHYSNGWRGRWGRSHR